MKRPAFQCAKLTRRDRKGFEIEQHTFLIHKIDRFI